MSLHHNSLISCLNIKYAPNAVVRGDTHRSAKNADIVSRTRLLHNQHPRNLHHKSLSSHSQETTPSLTTTNRHVDIPHSKATRGFSVRPASLSDTLLGNLIGSIRLGDGSSVHGISHATTNTNSHTTPSTTSSTSATSSLRHLSILFCGYSSRCGGLFFCMPF